jgi:hypothetical protein
MADLVELLAGQLERPREVTVQVEEYLNGVHGVDSTAIGSFLVKTLPGLEDDDHDLILSPLFTPRLSDQAIFAEVLGSESVPRKDWPLLVRQLAERPVRGHFVTSDRQTHVVPLREVTIERYVYRLRLDGQIPPDLMELLERVSPKPDQPLMKAVARRAIWEDAKRKEILVRYLSSASSNFQLADALYLLDTVESYKPSDHQHLLTMIPAWQERLRHEIDTAAEPRPFFTGQTQSEHGGDRDQRRLDEKRLEEKRREMEILNRLQHALGTSQDERP